MNSAPGARALRMNIRLKILTGFLAVLVILSILGVTAIVNLNDIRAKFDGLVEATQVERYAYRTIEEEKNYLLNEQDSSYQQAMQNIDTIIKALDTIDRHSRDADLLARSREARRATLEYRKGYEAGVAALRANATAVTRMAENGQTVVTLAEQYYQNTQESVALRVYITALEIMNAEKEERLYRNREFYQRMLVMRTQLDGYYNQLDPQGRDAQVNAARRATEAYFEAAATWIVNDDRLTQEILPTMQRLGEDVIKLAFEAARDAADSMIATQNLSNQVIASGVVITIVLGILIGIILSNMISKPLIYGVNFAKTIAEGDLTQRIEPQYLKRSDEIGDLAKALDEMVAQLQAMVMQVTDSTAQVSSAAAEIAQGSSDLSQRTEEQASAIEQTASSMEELTSTVKESAKNAEQANELARVARHHAEQGGEVVDQAIVAMGAINASSRRIADIISVIDEIAFQTNLLALNAAVEAARAGEQGRGFAVVAGEVRNLAQRSADSAKEIKVLITDSVDKVQDGVELVERSGATLKDIATAVKKVSDIVAEMAAASKEQAGGIEQVNKAIMQVDEVTQQNAALVEETAAASQNMGQQAQNLQEMMGFFKLNAHTGAVPARTPAKTAALPKPSPSHRQSASSERGGEEWQSF
ncbi:methyl-accepting chemotaxis protein [Thiorhodospira sibirica]|uniref:methyl-accepting chemotaxis protein n=1 Tax=Thiorhodospira sibirica TaxID=154347 RepID=UPI00022C3FF6|nr:methyl-accepting chemotaxis protein [Thiorhodospira sibirica]